MRLITTLLILGVFCVSAKTTYSQNVKVNLDFTNASLTEVFREIEKQSEFRFFYNDMLLNTTKKVSFKANNKLIKDVLELIFNDTDMTYKLVDKYIVITNKNEKTPEAGAQQSPDRKTITGTIIDGTGEPIIGASVVEKGTTNGISTDIDGNFSLTVDKDAILKISYIGYISQEMPVKDQTSLTITLFEDFQSLEEVIIVGYGAQKKVTLTGSVATLKGSDILKSPAVNISTTLAGRLSGVVVNSRSGEPGGDDATILIRGIGTTGDNSPLIIIDGVERAGFGQISGIARSGLGQLNPNDIESINVLKDSEAAIYGSRAANGVIVVTTKRGAQGKPKISFSYNQIFSQPTRNPKMADSYTFASIANEIRIREHANPNTSPVLAYTQEDMEKFRIGIEPGYTSTNYFDYMTRDWSPQHRSNVTVSGGNERVNYFFSLGELRQNGQFKHSSIKYNQYNVRSNIDAKIAESLTVSLDLSGQSDSRHAPYYGAYETISHIFLYAPNWQIYWPGTDYLKPLRGDQNVMNMVNDNAGYNDIMNKKFEGSLSAKWEIPWIKGLVLSARGSHDASYQYWKVFQTPSYVYTMNNNEYTQRVDGMGPSKSTLRDRSNMPYSTNLMTKIDYTRSFGDHNISAMAGYEQTQSKRYYLDASKPEFESTSLPILNVGGTDKSKWGIEGYETEFARQNYFGRLNYDYKSKYILQATMRVDGSSNFPKKNRYGYFPSVSAAWRLSEEAFLNNKDWLSNLKLRASWGMMGNDRIDAFQYLMTYSYGSNFVFNNADAQGIYETRVPNPNVTWETSETWNFGLDANLWNGLFGMEFEYFHSFRDNILGKRNATVPVYTGITLPDENIASVLNQGIELTLTHHNRIGDVYYNLSGNFAFARNEIKFIDEAPAAEPYQIRTGNPYGSELFYDAIGIFRDEEHVASYPHLANAGPGDLIFRDTNGDGVINEKDQILVTQTTIPEITFGLNASMEYKGFDLAILLQGQENAKIPMVKGKGNIYSNFFSTMSDSWGGFLQWRADDRWVPGADNANAKMPRAHSAFSNVNSNYNTHWIRNGGFLRFKNIELGYNIPSKITDKIGMSALRVSVSGNNLFMIYDGMKELGYDPETSDYWYYSIQRTVNFGINMTF